MKYWLSIFIIGLLVLFAFARPPKKGFTIQENQSEKRADVYYQGKLITSYLWQDSLMKPVYYPVTTISGTWVNRSYPLNKKAGERADHPHHIGIFFAHESVNGHDFWNMSTAIPPERRLKYGKIHHVSIDKKEITKSSALVATTSTWKTYAGEALVEEKTEMKIQAKGRDMIFDRSAELTALLPEVIFTDKKDALMAIRVARELELPVEGKDRMTMADGSITTEAVTNDKSQVTGNYRNSESIIGEAVWGKKAAWVCLDGMKDGKKISIAIIDHPKNTEYPSYWHARGYGLFAVNPLGKAIFSEGKASLNLTLHKGEKVLFRYRIIVREGDPLTSAELNNYATSF